MYQSIKFIAPVLFIMLLSACAQTQKAPVTMSVENAPFATGRAMINDGQGISPALMATNNTGTLSTIASTSEVQVFPLEGDTPNPFAGSRKHRTVFENTTSGGYTVLDKNVMVYPLDNTKRPSYLPQFEGAHSNVIQQDIGSNTAPLIGTPIDGFGAPGSSVAANNSLDRQSVFKTANDLPPLNMPPKLKMPAPSALKAPTPSPFDAIAQGPLVIEGNPNHNMPVTDVTPNIPGVTPLGAQVGVVIKPGSLTGYETADVVPMGAGLTGYQEKLPTTLAAENKREKEVKKYTSLAQRAGTRMSDVNLSSQEPIAMRKRWSAPSSAAPVGSVSMPETGQIPVAATPSLPTAATPEMITGGPIPLDGSYSNAVPVSQFDDGYDLPPEQPRRSPPSSRSSMLTGY